MSYTDEELKKAVQTVFMCYDQDRSGTLDIEEVQVLLKDALKEMHEFRKISRCEIQAFIASVDSNNDHKINQEELFTIFKKMLSSCDDE